MAYTTTINFPIEYVNPDETKQLKMIFTHANGTNRTWDAASMGIKNFDSGKNEIPFDLENSSLVPSDYSFTLLESGTYLESLLFGSDLNTLDVDVRGRVEVYVNGEERHIGYISEDSIIYGKAEKKFSFTSSPSIDLINKTNLYKEFQGETRIINVLGLTKGENINIVDLLEKIFQVGELTIEYPNSLHIFQNWKFYGVKTPFGGWLHEIPFENIALRADNVAFNSELGISTVGDLLRQLAVEFGCFTGLVSQNKAFFKKLFYFNPDNVQDVRVFNHKPQYKFGLVDYVETHVINKKDDGLTPVMDPPYFYAPSEDAFTSLSDRFIKKDLVTFAWESMGYYATNIFASMPGTDIKFFKVSGSPVFAVGDTYSHNGSTYTFEALWTDEAGNGVITVSRTAGTNEPLSSGTLTRVTGTGEATIAFSDWERINGNYNIYGAYDPDINVLCDTPTLLAKFLYYWRGNIRHCRVDQFTLVGVNYDFMKDFIYNGSKYQPVSMAAHYSKNITECEALYLGEV
jgi:hypothetical protein